VSHWRLPPVSTAIQGHQVPSTTNGDGAVRCVYLAGGGVLSGFTLTNGATRSVGDSTNEQSGGGIFCTSVSALVTNCVLQGNSARNNGGAVYSGTLKNCTLMQNSAAGSRRLKRGSKREKWNRSGTGRFI
jgi:predicted outer membrane repeat protein